MPKNPHDLLAAIANQHTVAQHALDRLGGMIASYRDMVPDTRNGALRSTPKIKSLVAWVDWLSENGPAHRQAVWDGTGMNLSASASAHVRKWKESMEMSEDHQIPADTLFTISGPREEGKRGRPPVIYFLWSQRYDLLSTFGVGPERPPQSNEPETLTGVIRPPEDNPWPEYTEAPDLTEPAPEAMVAPEPIPLPEDCDRCDYTGEDPADHEYYHRVKGIA